MTVFEFIIANFNSMQVKCWFFIRKWSAMRALMPCIEITLQRKISQEWKLRRLLSASKLD